MFLLIIDELFNKLKNPPFFTDFSIRFILSLGFSYGISESYANKIFHKIRPILADVVGLKNASELKYKDIKNIIIDVTVQPIERPQENQELYFNGSKKSTL